MKNFFPVIFTSLLALCLSSTASAQKAGLPDSQAIKKPIEFPPLEELIDSAIKKNAMMGYRSREIEAKKLNVSSQRNYWLRNIGVQSDFRYGTIDAFSTNANGVGTNSSSTTSKQFNYAVGVYLKVPIYDVVNRKGQIKTAQVELEQARLMAQVQQDELRQIVIRQYQEVLLRQKIVSIKASNLGSATVNMEMIEKEFRNGVIPLAEYVRISDMTARIRVEYEMASSDFLVAKKILEEIVGFSFKNPSLTTAE
jgi:outer membrane protein TolC